MPDDLPPVLMAIGALVGGFALATERGLTVRARRNSRDPMDRMASVIAQALAEYDGRTRERYASLVPGVLQIVESLKAHDDRSALRHQQQMDRAEKISGILAVLLDRTERLRE